MRLVVRTRKSFGRAHFTRGGDTSRGETRDGGAGDLPLGVACA
jgi:hypothetical protein